jgi:hypothetical protein
MFNIAQAIGAGILPRRGQNKRRIRSVNCEPLLNRLRITEEEFELLVGEYHAWRLGKILFTINRKVSGVLKGLGFTPLREFVCFLTPFSAFLTNSLTNSLERHFIKPTLTIFMYFLMIFVPFHFRADTGSSNKHF